MRIKRSLSAIIATIFIAAVPLAASAQVSVGIGLGFNIGTPPPPIPSYYSVPPAPYPNYQWQPGYWAWGPAGYYWVPGTWVAPPSVGMYWTPGYWGAGINGGYAWNAGYWGPQVGFYGGINYGYGYYGTGFVGGYWSGGAFNYNTAVLPVNRTVIHNVYINKTVINKGRVCGGNCRASFNGPHGGINARPTHAEIAARDRGVRETSAQREHERDAAQDRALYARANGGRPPVTSVQKPINNAKSLPHYEAVRDGDRQAAQADVRHGTTQGAPQRNAVESAPRHEATQSHPHNNEPPQSTHANAQMHANAHYSSGNSMRGNGGMYGAHEGGSRPSRGSTQGHSGGNGPSGGNAKSKPPRR